MYEASFRIHPSYLGVLFVAKHDPERGDFYMTTCTCNHRCNVWWVSDPAHEVADNSISKKLPEKKMKFRLSFGTVDLTKPPPLPPLIRNSCAHLSHELASSICLISLEIFGSCPFLEDRNIRTDLGFSPVTYHHYHFQVTVSQTISQMNTTSGVKIMLQVSTWLRATWYLNYWHQRSTCNRVNKRTMCSLLSPEKKSNDQEQRKRPHLKPSNDGVKKLRGVDKQKNKIPLGPWKLCLKICT
jgi:hypothetical protein